MAVQNFSGGGGFQVSPGISISEIDLTTTTTAVDTTTGGYAGVFRWGPVNDPVLVSSEADLVTKFGRPTNMNAEGWFTAANFLAYSNALLVVRGLQTNTQFAAIGSEANLASSAVNTILNQEDFEARKTTILASGPEVIAKWPGELGNSLKVSVCDSPDQYSSQIVLSAANTYFEDANTRFTLAIGSTTATINLINDNGLSPTAQTTPIYNQFVLGDMLEVGTNSKQLLKIVAKSPIQVGLNQFDEFTGSSSFTVTFSQPLVLAEAVSTQTVARFWEYANLFDRAPGRSEYVTAAGNTALQLANTAAQLDELHIVVADEDGLLTGSAGSVLELYSSVSRATDAVASDGATLYYKNVVNERSQYIWVGRDRSTAASGLARTVASSSATAPFVRSLAGGVDVSEANLPFSALAAAYDKFGSAEEVDVSLIITGPARGGLGGSQLANYVIDNIAEARKDVVVFVSPKSENVVFASNPANSIVEFRNTLRSSSYAVMDSGYKYQYDKYNDVNRYIPLNGDIAGLCVRTDADRDPWFSPAGVNRGSIKNVIKLAFNPSKAERDTLYKNGINPVITQQGYGTILYGDKTLLARPSAFDRINVRRLFITLQKTISRAANAYMFEFNDEFTRSQFVSTVEPFLRDVQSRRGITDFKVVCDDTNNTPEIIDSNRFIGDIYVKPTRSINFIRLNFVAVRTGVEFTELTS
jgi:hypothetical protein